MSRAEKKQLVLEVNILRELRHPNIVRYYERIVDKENFMIYIIMEYCSGGDLASIIKRCKREGKIISEEIIWSMFVQLLLALELCHHGAISVANAESETGAILHRDIKPEVQYTICMHACVCVCSHPCRMFCWTNCKTSNWATLASVVCLSRVLVVVLPKPMLGRKFRLVFRLILPARPYYMSPEIVNESLYDTKSDVWALGCLIYELCALKYVIYCVCV